MRVPPIFTAPLLPGSLIPKPTCKTCESGKMRLTKKYRMNAVVVIIGYILLIPFNG